MIDLTYYKEMENRKGSMLTEKEIETTFNVLLFSISQEIEFSYDYKERESKELRKIIKKLNSLESFFDEITYEIDEINEGDETEMHEEILALKCKCGERLAEIYHEKLKNLIENQAIIA